MIIKELIEILQQAEDKSKDAFVTVFNYTAQVNCERTHEEECVCFDIEHISDNNGNVQINVGDVE